jgi:hypothetical protein
MSRTVISVQELLNVDGSVVTYFRITEPTNVPEAERARVLDCDPERAPFSDLAAEPATSHGELDNELVKSVGRKVFESLSQHPGVLHAIDQAANAGPGEAWPIFIETSAIVSESLPWEVMYHPTAEFLCLDPRWPIARITGGGRSERIAPYFDPPLRIAAILGAADCDATPEWEALRGAVDASGLPCQVTLFLAQDEVARFVQAQGNGWVDVRRIPDTNEDLVDALVGLRPHFLHVFCHGSATSGYLEIATRNLIDLGKPPLYLAAQELGRLTDVVWLITLDACEGAAPAVDVHSFAYSLVKDGLPAAVGMREPINSGDASVFCGAFYKETLAYLAGNLNPGKDVGLPWPVFMRAPRSALCKRHPGPLGVKAARHKEWTLPVLYQRPEPFHVRVVRMDPAVSPEERSRLFAEMNMLRKLLEGLHPDTPARVRDGLKENIVALEEQLSPNGQE